MKNTVRLSFDVPADEHIQYKTECVKSRIPIKDFLHNLVILGMHEYEKNKFKKKMKSSIKQAKQGKTKKLRAEDLDKWEKELDDA